MTSEFTRKIRYRLVSVLTSPFLLALLLSLGIYLYFLNFSKYSIQKISSSISDKANSLEFAFDINNNGIYEKIILFNSNLEKAAVKIINDDAGILGWWDFEGIACTDIGLIADYNHDNRFEFYFISCEKDSILIHQLSYNQQGQFNHISRFLAKTKIIDGKVDVQFSNIDTCDLQQDHYQEIAISVNAGYSLQPRKLFLWDLKNDRILQSPDMGVNGSYTPVNLDDDPYPEFIANSNSTDNLPDTSSIPYTDKSSWLIVLDHTLKFYFPPVENPGHKTAVSIDVLKSKNSTCILSLFDYTSKGKPTACLKTFNLNGNILKTKELENYTRHSSYRFFSKKLSNSDQPILIETSGKSYSINCDLTIEPLLFKLPENSNISFQADLNQDGKIENIFQSSDYETITITQSDFSEPTSCTINFSRNPHHFSLEKDSTGYPLLFIQSGDVETTLKFSLNPFYTFRYLLGLGILLIITLLIYLVRWQYSLQQRRKKKMGERIAELQLSLLSRHLDPHFTFNTLNTISAFIYNEKKEEAHAMFSKFTSLIRYTMEHSSSHDTSLREELDFLKLYLDIQQKRYNNAFNYEIFVRGDVELERKIPRLLLQQYAENSLKHGISGLNYPGKLIIELNRQGKQLNISIQDNGKGRKKAMLESDGRKGSGLNTMESIYVLFGKLTGTSITQSIEDLYNEDQTSAGTKINLRIIFP